MEANQLVKEKEPQSSPESKGGPAVEPERRRRAGTAVRSLALLTADARAQAQAFAQAGNLAQAACSEMKARAYDLAQATVQEMCDQPEPDRETGRGLLLEEAQRQEAIADREEAATDPGDPGVIIRGYRHEAAALRFAAQCLAGRGNCGKEPV